MTPQDPNFPSEIPPVPPPRNSDEAGPANGDELPSSGLDPRSTAGEEDAKPARFTQNDRSSDPNRLAESGVDQGNTSHSDDPTADPASSNGRPPAPSPRNWTDSDRKNSKDPLSVPSPGPKPTYGDRGPQPDSAATPGKRARSVSPADDVWADTGIPYQPKELGVIDQLLLLLAEGATVWKKGLRWVRSLLPPDLQRQLSDEILTAIALGLIMLLLALWNPLGTGQDSRGVASEPLPPISATDDDANVLSAEPTSSEPVPAVASEPAPLADPTPEQSLIADIQDRVSRISRSYGSGLIQSVEVNLPENTLNVNVDDAWYGLLTTQQDQVAQDIYHQAQGLSLGTLQLRDSEGVTVARNPVVGPNMVVLHRLRQS